MRSKQLENYDHIDNYYKEIPYDFWIAEYLSCKHNLKWFGRTPRPLKDWFEQHHENIADRWHI